MFDNILSVFFGSKHDRDVKALLPILHKINAKEAWAASLDKSDFPRITAEFREKLRNGAPIDELIPEAFALVRETARRTLGERPYDVQMMAGIVLHQGRIVEMKTGEGKTLMSVAPMYINALSGKGVHVVTVNDYLAERDAAWMKPIFDYLGVSVGAILSTMDNDARKAAYACDITYGTNNEFGFDYLRDNMKWSLEDKVQRGHNYCIVDEIDSILIDEARTPLIISGPADDETAQFMEADKVVPLLVEVEKDPNTGEYPREDEGEVLVGDYKLDEKSKRVTFTADGLAKIEQYLLKRNLIKDSIYNEDNFQWTHYVTQAMRAHHMFHIDVDYVIQEGLVQIVDEFTGRVLTGRRYSDGLHEAIEAKERIKVAHRNRTMATITFQNFFRMYTKISGMTGTADTEAEEFQKIYNLDVVVIPTNRPVVRADEDDLVYLNEDDKFKAICDEIAEVHAKGQPILVGTVSIEKSEKLSLYLTRKGVRHEVLNAKNHAREALIIAEAGAKGSVTIATNMAGRGTDIKLGGNPDFRARRRAGTKATPEEYQAAYELEYEQWRKDYDEVRSLGGLYVLGTERHESRRIDNQLRGRSGRQGDPGRSRFYISLDDELMRLFGGDRMKSLMSRIGMQPGEPIYHPMLNKTIANAQRKVEERNFEIRKHLLEYDDVLNEQRKYIYDQRDSILSDANLKARVLDSALDMAHNRMIDFKDESRGNQKAAMVSLQTWLKDNFNQPLPADRAQELVNFPDKISAAIKESLEADLQAKVEYAGDEGLNQFIRLQYLQAIDQKWLDHLENLEALREAVYLRNYGQKNPLIEYKLEGFDIFDTLIAEIKEQLANRLFLVRIKRAEERQAPVTRVVSTGAAVHQEVSQFSGSSGSGTASASHSSAMRGGPAGRSGPVDQSRSASEQVKRALPKVGRNDPCPCGSGKKYKYCHGK
jgi:preprotein translocase subunit SecA